jgi:hypothetical protein
VQPVGVRELAAGEGLAPVGNMRTFLAIVVASLVGCAAEDAPPVGYPEGLGTPTDPLPGYEAYWVRSHVVLSLGNTQVDQAIAQLQAFSQHGGTTLLAQSAGTPARQALDSLPTNLRANLDAWIDVELDKQKLGTVPARQAVGDIATMAHTVVTEFDLESSLTITPTGAQHSLSDINFRPSALDVIVPIGGLSADKLDQRPTSQVAAGGALTVGDHHFALALGSHAWQGLGLGVEAKYGGDLSIVQHLDCNAVAQSVAARCMSGSCVGHASDISAICRQGTTALVDHLRDALAPIVLDTLRFTHGTAHLVDDNGDGVADHIMGTWDGETSVGAGMHAIQVAFTAKD